MLGNRPKIVLGADSLLQHATGIGNYTRHLAQSLLQEQLVEELLLYAHGIFLSKESLRESLCKTSADPALNGKGAPNALLKPLALVRASLTKIGAAQILHSKISPYIDKSRLRSCKGAIFHSPNYVLPAFDGLCVTTFHDLSIQLFPQFHPDNRVRLLNSSMDQAAEKADHVITDSELVRQQVINYYSLAEEKVTCIHLGASDQFRPRSQSECEFVLQKLGLSYRKFFLFTSTIEPRKNVRRICRAYVEFRDKAKRDIPIIFVGERGWKSDLEHQDIKELVQRGWAQYLGFVPTNELAALYSSATALVFPSIYEGFGLPVLEAKKSNTKVITSRDSAMSEFVSEEDILVDPQDVSEIASGMMAMSTLDVIRTFKGPANKQDALTWGETARKTAKVYRELS